MTNSPKFHSFGVAAMGPQDGTRGRRRGSLTGMQSGRRSASAAAFTWGGGQGAPFSRMGMGMGIAGFRFRIVVPDAAKRRRQCMA